MVFTISKLSKDFVWHNYWNTEWYFELTLTFKYMTTTDLEFESISFFQIVTQWTLFLKCNSFHRKTIWTFFLTIVASKTMKCCQNVPQYSPLFWWINLMQDLMSLPYYIFVTKLWRHNSNTSFIQHSYNESHTSYTPFTKILFAFSFAKAKYACWMFTVYGIL